ncbi:unnamed protein product [Linum trigynum]|uniref:protein-serine/threonine phosphatase n=1 Tax=Linum trigynum TaxID=586398 RepID=A0AAV2GYC2_9ROSI
MDSADEEKDQQLDRDDSLSDLASSASSSSALSALWTEDSSRSGSASSFDIGSSGEIPLSEVEFAAAAATMEVSAAAREKCVGRKNNRAVSWGSTSVIGRRREMEDAVAIVPGFISRTCSRVGGCAAPGSATSAEVSPVHFFGVYDGHGGSQVADFCKERMHHVIAEEYWDRETAEKTVPMAAAVGFDVDDDQWRRRWEATFTGGFGKADDEILAEAVAPEIVGSTALVVVLSCCQIITSNCGDSRALLCRGTQAIPLSVDQKPDREDELKRIEDAGGKVFNWNGARVLGVLAMSRAIGDRHLRPYVIPVPEITFTARREDDECLIAASDGLWDVMTNDEVGEVARRVLRRWRRAPASSSNSNITAAQAVADSLTEMAYGRNSSDNISVVVVDLKPKRRRAVPARAPEPPP